MGEGAEEAMIATIFSRALIVSLVLAPHVAWAECAWVLWVIPSAVKQIMPDGTIVWGHQGQWSVVSAYTTHSECNAAAVGLSQINLKARRQPLSVGDMFASWQCFPDTVDPSARRGTDDDCF